MRRNNRRSAGGDRFLNRLVDTHMTRFVRRTDADFSTFFMRYYRLPYDTWASLAHHRFGFVMRFESLSDDFDHVLRMIGVEPQRALPIANVTESRQPDYTSYYEPRTWQRARRVLGPYMARWGYRFPDAWGIRGPTRMDWLGYRAFSVVACIYWRYRPAAP